jgi:hypothetical protein
MKALKIKTFQRCEFVLGNDDIPLTATDVDTVMMDIDPETTLAENEGLMKFLASTSGTGETYFIQTGPAETSVACFSQTLEGQRALLEFGDVFMIDGISIDDRLHLDVFPITVIDRNRRIFCGGVFFLGLQTSHMFLWMLRRIYAVAGDRWMTLLTDEDSAMIVAVPQFLEESCVNMRHCLCVFHEFRNLRKHIDRLMRSQSTRLSLLNFAQTRYSSKKRTKADEALEKMLGTAPELAHYVDVNVRPLLAQFGDCCKSDGLTLGCRATAMAESANAMIRGYTPNRLLSLTEMCRSISTTYGFPLQTITF